MDNDDWIIISIMKYNCLIIIIKRTMDWLTNWEDSSIIMIPTYIIDEKIIDVRWANG